ncbi:MAG TPA: hypothetical protein VKU44_03845 [Terriglobia bacterium]|nr:hypothetical protein [Terriglobia bacterium]
MGNPSDPSMSAGPPTSRRGWLKTVAAWSSQIGVLKQVGTAATGMVSGGALVYHYVEPRLNVLTEKDFRIQDDHTVVSLKGSNAYVEVKVERIFAQEATRTGYYPYQRYCDGSWIENECSMVLRRPDGSSQPVGLKAHPVQAAKEIDNEGEGDLLSVIEPRGRKPISVSDGDNLQVKLVSVENVEKVKGGYRLRFNAALEQSSFTLHVEGTPAVPPQIVECFVYAEKQGQALVPVSLERALELKHCHKGIEFLISWAGRVQV